MRLLETLASLKLTLTFLLLLLTLVVIVYLRQDLRSSLLAAPLGLLSVNLLAAIVTNRGFRRQSALLVFHIALLVLVLLLLASRLSYLKGNLELADGEEFSGTLLETDAGPLHPIDELKKLHFSNLGFHIDYAPGPLRQGIRNLVEIIGPNGVPQHIEIADQHPLVLSGYRFYPTGNKGFAPTFRWLPAHGGAVHVGAVNLPSYPLHELGQAREWTPPGTQLRIWTMLEFDEIILAPDRPSEFHPPKQHRIVLRIEERRWELGTGDAIELPEGRLEYQGLRGWMGYTVFYDWTVPWLLATCLVAISALAVHFRSKFSATPWNE